MKIQLDEQELVDDLGKHIFNYDKYMEQLRNASNRQLPPQINVGQYLEFFRTYAERKIPVLYVAFSECMSGSYSSALQAVELLKEEYLSVLKLHVFDTNSC